MLTGIWTRVARPLLAGRIGRQACRISDAPFCDSHGQGEQTHVLHGLRIFGLGAIPAPGLPNQIGGELLAGHVVVHPLMPKTLRENRFENSVRPTGHSRLLSLGPGPRNAALLWSGGNVQSSPWPP